METSDSECFESADEEFFGEDECRKSQNQESIATVIEQIQQIKVIEPPFIENQPPSKFIKAADNMEKKNKAIRTRNKLGVKVNRVSNESKSNDLEAKHEKTESRIAEQQKESISKEEVNLWEDDDNWQSYKKETDNLPTNSGWTSWSNWNVTSILNSASAGVTTISNHVSQGLTSVLETGIGAPNPEELAKINSFEKPQNTEPVNLTFGLSNFVSGVTHITKFVETTGNKVVKGGLDTLETIGKKTMEVLQEGDPGFKKKRAFLKINSDKPVLSHILREAKEKADIENKFLEEQQFARKANYESLFDDHQGLVHLEALEILSKQCDIKLQTVLDSLSGNDLVELQETLNQIEELCELVEDEDELEAMSQVREKLDIAISEMNVNISYDKLLNTWNEASDWLESLNLKMCSEMELHEQAIDTLAQLTALAVERYHKIGELLLVKEHRSTADEADSLVQLTMTLTALTSFVAAKLSNKLSEKLISATNKDEISKLITNIYFESANSSSYIKNAFQLLIPVLQVGAI